MQKKTTKNVSFLQKKSDLFFLTDNTNFLYNWMNSATFTKYLEKDSSSILLSNLNGT